MTRRERILRRLEKRREWAASRERKAAESFGAADRMASAIPMGQPILIGHHSERRDRRYRERIGSKLRQGGESADMARHHKAKADGIERQLETSIFSDDSDALDAIRSRIAQREAEAAHIVAYNATCRKAARAGEKHGDLSLLDEEQRLKLLKTLQLCPYHLKPGMPFPSYVLTNLRGNIRRDKERLDAIGRQQEMAKAAEAAPGRVVIRGETYVSITFSEKPDYGVLRELKGAGFRWGGGSWNGSRDRIPACVLALAESTPPTQNKEDA